MAALQSIRSHGPLLVGVIALGLFAFIAGDAWRVLAPHQSQDAGEVNGESLSAQDFQTLVEEYSNAVKFSQGLSALTDEQNDAIKDQVWNSYVNNKIIEAEAEKLGLQVSDKEMQDIVNEGTYPLLAQTPFRNQQTGAFDKDMLNMFLVQYQQMSTTQTTADMAEYYRQLYTYWTFVEKMIRQNRLAEKYQALISKSLLANKVESQLSFEARVNQSDFLMAAVPYTSVVDSTIVVSQSELQAAYDAKKEQFRQYVETRDIRYIDVQVTASAEDRAALEKEIEEYTTQMRGNVDDYATFVRQAGSDESFVDLYYTANGLPSDVVSRLDSVEVGGVFGPYYNTSDNTLNSFKKIAAATMPDSIQFRQIQVTAETQARAQQLSDSIFNAIKGGADFAELAEKYGQTGATQWITSANYQGAQIDGENLKYIGTITTLPQNQLTNLSLSQANIILEVTARHNPVEKYKVAVVKLPIEFSKETYNKAYNNFSEFVAANSTFEKMVENAEEAGYRLYTQSDVSSSSHNIGSVRGTKDALRWVFNAKAGEASPMYECGESDHLMMVGLARVNKEGYRPLAQVADQLRPQLIRDKKADKIIADMKAANATSIDQYKNLPGAVSDSIKRVTFAASAYVAATQTAEPAISALAATAKDNSLSAPQKGNGGVFVLQRYNQSAGDETYDEASEMTRLETMRVNIAQQQYMSDLYLKADVKDDRYLFF